MKNYKNDVFISYSRADLVDEHGNVRENSVVSKLMEALEKAGISYWIDLDGISHGDMFAAKIAAAIEESRVLLLVSTKASNESKWTAREVAAAENIGHPIIPFKVDDTPYNRTVRLYLANLDYVDYQKLGDKSYAEIVSSVRRASAMVDEEEENARRQAEEQKRKEEERLHRMHKEQEKKEKLAAIEGRIAVLRAQRAEKQGELSAIEADAAILKAEIDSIDGEIVQCDAEKRELLGIDYPAARREEKRIEAKVVVPEKAGKTEKHFFVQSLYLLGLFSVLCVIIGMLFYDMFSAFAFVLLAAGIMGVLFNWRYSLWLLGISEIICLFPLSNLGAGIIVYTVYILLALLSWALLFIPKNGIPAWKAVMNGSGWPLKRIEKMNKR